MKTIGKIAIVLLALFGCLVIVCIGGALFTPSVSQTTPTPNKYATATPVNWAPPYNQLCKRDRSLTDVQYVEWMKSFEGKKIVNWTGWVYDVRDGPVLLIAVRAPGGILWARDIEMVGLNTRVYEFNKEDKVRFSGTIRSMGSFLGRPCNPIVLENGKVERVS